MKRIIITTACLLLVAGAAWLKLGYERQAPDVVFNLTTGGQVKTSDYLGKPLLVNFWSLTCPVCIKDIPQMERLQQEQKANGLTVLAVSVHYDPPPNILSTLARIKPKYLTAFDVQQEINIAFGANRATPTTFLISPKGKIVYKHIGEFEYQRLTQLIEAF